MNIAIIIGVSQYSTQQDLPAVSNDLSAIEAVIRQSGKYDEVLVLSDDVKSDKAKMELASFVEKYEGQDINEIFFYYSGHGDFKGDDFYYIFSNFDEKRYRATTLSNDEVDVLLKSLKPKLAVKVIDACHAGVNYIKDIDSFEKHINRTVEGFDKCYFLFSSQVSQVSHADQKLSFFTSSLISSLVSFPGESIRYKDVIDYISDSFVSNSSQTPFFVTQASFTECFLDNLSEIKKHLSQYVNLSGGIAKSAENDELEERIKKDLSRCCTQEGALQIIGGIETALASFKLPGKLVSFYDMAITKISDNDTLPRAHDIGNWLNINSTEENFFASAMFKKQKARPVETRVAATMPNRLGGFGLPIAFSGQMYKYNALETYDEVFLSGFNTKLSSEFNGFSIRVNSKVLSLPDFVYYVVPIFSKRKLALFTAMSTFIDNSWEDKRLYNNFKWDLDLNDAVDIQEVDTSLLRTLSKYNQYIMNAIEGILSKESSGPIGKEKISPGE